MGKHGTRTYWRVFGAPLTAMAVVVVAASCVFQHVYLASAVAQSDSFRSVTSDIYCLVVFGTLLLTLGLISSRHRVVLGASPPRPVRIVFAVLSAFSLFFMVLGGFSLLIHVLRPV